VDDIISTGGSIASAARIVKEAGAQTIFAVCVHALMVGGAEELLASSGVLGLSALTRLKTDSRLTVLHQNSWRNSGGKASKKGDWALR